VGAGGGVGRGVGAERAELLEREQAGRAKLERANADMESLLYTVSHDLKSPLFALLGYLDLVRLEGGEGLGEAAVYVDRMAGTAGYMQQLINDLLTLSRIGRMEARSEDVDVSTVAASVIAESQTAHPGARFEVGPLPLVHMSPVRARQLLTNLVDNAVRHSGRPDVTVTIEAVAEPDGGAKLCVSDDGRGIPTEDRERVFGVFEHLQQRGDGDGTGVGLAVCRKIAEHVGGSARIVDASTGARVEIAFPAVVVRRHQRAAVVGA
jgi:signal transduction histidine kinase